MTTRIAVLLSGCGVFDGSEIHEAVLTMLSLDRRNAVALLCAPRVAQRDVVDHLKREPVGGDVRNVLVEAARIARGDVRDVAAVTVDEVDGLVLPGGFGAAKNLSDFAVHGAACTVQPDVARFARDVHAAGKPIAALCIAPVILARLFGSEHPRLTIGIDHATAGALEQMGAVHVGCTAQGVVVDNARRFVTSPAYMLGTRISEVAAGIDAAVEALIEMATSEVALAWGPGVSGAAPRRGV